ncbi:MAG: OmpA family protein [Bacteroidales bacterium]|nr:OmpA family protein [Bacteroidales bacterium]
MKRLLLSISVLAMVCGTAHAQSFLDKIKDRAKDAAEQNIGNKVEKGVNDLLDGKVGKKDKNNKAWTCDECGKTGNSGQFCEDCGAKMPGGEPAPAAKPAPKKQVESAYAKSDFVPGDEIFFDDPVEGERLGEFPSHWDFLGGEECEIMTIDGKQAIKLSGWFSDIAPLMKEENYLPEEFTVEFDVWSNPTGGSSNNDHIDLVLRSDEYSDYCVFVALNPAFNELSQTDGPTTLDYSFYSPGVDIRNGTTPGDNVQKLIEPDSWLHVAASFNKRAFKYYVNGVRMVNLPNVARPTRMLLRSVSNCDEKDRFFIKNVRLAKGAVPLYDRLASEGKIVTYAITFETGKADLKPESMVEINRIAKLMQENPGLEFEVQGHCDATGSDKVNDPLSQKRAEAIVAALVEQGIAESRLTQVGKGSHEPIASNSTDEGRAKNRRVEFVKK